MINKKYSGTSIYVQGIYTTIPSICKYIKVYVGISRYMRVHARIKHFDKMRMTPGSEP